MAKRNPRIPDEDYLTEDELLMGGLEGEWVRTAAYKNGHKVSRDGRIAICGAPLVVSHQHWESFRSAFEANFGSELPAYWMAHDRRKTSKCARCKGTDHAEMYDPMAEDTVEPGTEYQGCAPRFTPRELTPADRLQQARFRSKVQMVSRELSATEVPQA